MADILAFDTETERFGPGNRAPRMACVTWRRPTHEARIQHARDAEPMLRDWITGPEPMAGHNTCYDTAVFCSNYPPLVPAIFAKYDRDEITDTMLREKLLAIAHGCFRGQTDGGDWRPMKYGLADCYHRRTSVWLEKDEWRLRYGEFLDVPIEQWPEGARRYPLMDADATLVVHDSQESDRYSIEAGDLFANRDLLVDQYRQSRAAFALHLSTCWGITTDPKRTAELEGRLRGEFDGLVQELQALGIVRPDGTANTAAAKEVMEQACTDTGRSPMRTKTGEISLASDWCEEVAGDEDSGEPRTQAQEAVAAYSRFLTLRKNLSNDIEMLHRGLLHPEYSLAESGRATCRGGVHTVARNGGIRECFVPRDGYVFAQADFEGLELHTLAQWCLKNVGYSKMAESLRAGEDLHLRVGAHMLGIPYEQAAVLYKAGDKAVKEARQQGKPINFGRPGGLGDARYVDFAKKAYGVVVSLAEAKAQKEMWLGLFPEIREFFALAAAACANMDGLGAEATLFSERWGSKIPYSALCNRRFQGLGADAAKRALWLVTRACYAEPWSPLYGCRVVAFIHDELILEVLRARADAAARELGRLMELGASEFLPDVTPKAPPTLQEVWSKEAKAIYDEAGLLIPWSPNVAVNDHLAAAA